MANAINNLGQVAGYSKTSGGEDHAFVYSNGTMTDLGSTGTPSYAYGINDSGTVAGYTFDAATSNSTAFEDVGGVMHSLGSLQGASGSSFAFGVNSSGQVVGYSMPAPRTTRAIEAFIYSGGTMTGLGGLSTDSDTGQPNASQGTGINDSGTTVGYAEVPTGQDLLAEHAFVDAGTMTDLGLGDGSVAHAINNAGQIVAISQSGAYLISGGTSTVISSDPGVEPSSINNNGDVVGYVQTTSAQSDPFLYKNGQMIDLSSLLPANSGWTLTNANAINNSDQIVGTGTYQGHQQAYLLSLNGSPTRPAVTWANPTSIIYGTALGAAQLDATAGICPGHSAIRPPPERCCTRATTSRST